MTTFFVFDMMSFGQFKIIGALVCVALACLLAIWLGVRGDKR